MKYFACACVLTEESLWLLSSHTLTILNDAREASLCVAVCSESMDKHNFVHQTELTVKYRQTNRINRKDSYNTLFITLFSNQTEYTVVYVCKESKVVSCE